jgi:hypothetical protein
MLRPLQGIEANLRLVKEHYPGWQMRLYHDTGPDLQDRLCALGEGGTLIVHVGVPLCWSLSL